MSKPLQVAASSLIGSASAIIGNLFVVRDNHPPFPCGDLLIGIERKHGNIAKCSNISSSVRPEKSFTGIFDNFKIMLPCYFHDLIHVTALSKDMDDKDSFCPRSYCLFNQVMIDVKRIFLNINKYRCCSFIKDAVGRCYKGERRGYHFIHILDSKSLDG